MCVYMIIIIRMIGIIIINIYNYKIDLSDKYNTRSENILTLQAPSNNLSYTIQNPKR